MTRSRRLRGVRVLWHVLDHGQTTDKRRNTGFLWFVLGRNYHVVLSMSKARKAGWTGYQDTWDSISETLDELVAEKVLPKFP